MAEYRLALEPGVRHALKALGDEVQPLAAKGRKPVDAIPLSDLPAVLAGLDNIRPFVSNMIPPGVPNPALVEHWQQLAIDSDERKRWWLWEREVLYATGLPRSWVVGTAATNREVLDALSGSLGAEGAEPFLAALGSALAAPAPDLSWKAVPVRSFALTTLATPSLKTLPDALAADAAPDGALQSSALISQACNGLASLSPHAQDESVTSLLVTLVMLAPECLRGLPARGDFRHRESWIGRLDRIASCLAGVVALG